MGIMGVLGGIFPFDRLANAARNRQEDSQFGQPAVRRSIENTQGLVGLFRRWRASAVRPARMALLERITLGPRQALLLVEADGVRLLVATSADGAPAFYPLPAASTGAGKDYRMPYRSGISNGAGLARGSAVRTVSDIRLGRDSGRVSW